MSAAEKVLYLTTIRCKECGNGTTYAHMGPNVPLDRETPWPDDVQLCPECGTHYPDDLGEAIEEVSSLPPVGDVVGPHNTDTDRSGGGGRV